MIKCTVHKLSASKTLYLEDSNKKTIASTIKDSLYLYKIPTKLAEILEDDDIVYLDIDENYELQISMTAFIVLVLILVKPS